MLSLYIASWVFWLVVFLFCFGTSPFYVVLGFPETVDRPGWPQIHKDLPQFGIKSAHTTSGLILSTSRYWTPSSARSCSGSWRSRLQLTQILQFHEAWIQCGTLVQTLRVSSKRGTRQSNMLWRNEEAALKKNFLGWHLHWDLTVEETAREWSGKRAYRESEQALREQPAQRDALQETCGEAVSGKPCLLPSKPDHRRLIPGTHTKESQLTSTSCTHASYSQTIK